MPPLIARHHAEDPWRPMQAWADTVYVQWGDHGLVMVEGGKSYGTAFFEAFPKDGSSSFIRGEGADLEAAEVKAFKTWRRHLDCHLSRDHRWSRSRRLKSGGIQTYTNGGCHCLKCGAFEMAMAPVVSLGRWRDPINVQELESVAAGYCRQSPNGPDNSKWRRRMELRARASGINLPPIQPRGADWTYLHGDTYTAGCARAVADFCKANPEILGEKQSSGGLADFFEEMSLRTLKRVVEEA